MKTILGARIRARRRSLEISQTDLAKRIEISPSYLNLIEHNKRQIGGTLLNRLANELGIGLEELDGAAEKRLLATIEEIGHLPDMGMLGIEVERAGEFVGRYPGWAKSVAALARSGRENADIARALADRLTHDAFLGESVHKMLTAISALRSASEILKEFPDIDSERREQFHDILVQESENLTGLGEALASYLDKSEFTERTLTPLDEVESFFESRQNSIQEIEEHAQSSAKQLQVGRSRPRLKEAASIAESKMGDVIDSLITNEHMLETEVALKNARTALINYARDALLVPMDAFLKNAQDLDYDLEALAELYSIGVETICHRLAAMPAAEGRPRFGYLVANAAGTIITARSLPGIASPRYGFACPLWVLYRAQQSPEAIVRQRVLFPDGNEFVFLARARLQGPGGFGRPRHYLSDMITLSEEDAKLTVYKPDPGVPVERVGTTCRSCPRRDCMNRVSDPIAG